MKITLVILIAFISATVRSDPKPQEDAAPAEGDAPAADAPPADAPPAEAPAEGAEPAEGGETTPAGAAEAPADGAATEETTVADGASPSPDAEGETTTPMEGAEGEQKEGEGGDMVEAKLTFGPEETTPENVVTDRWGSPLRTTNVMNFTLPKGGGVKVYSEQWKTFYTKPATKPGCLCVSRAPLPPLKLYGNIHFKRIKVVPPSYVTLSTEPSSTLCPPCVCPRCEDRDRR